MYVPAEDGSWVDEKIARIAELIRNYDPRLRLSRIRPELKQPGDAEFAIIESTPDGKEHVSFLIQDESWVDERLLARIYAADNAHGDVQAQMEAKNKAIKDVIAAERQDELTAANDLAFSMLNSPLHTYKHNGRKTSL